MRSLSWQSFSFVTLCACSVWLAGCTAPSSSSPASPTSSVTPAIDQVTPTLIPTSIPTPANMLTVEKAKAIALQSECRKFGTLSDSYFYNPHSQTWWFDIDRKTTGCNPACVVDETTKTATVNWRCTGGQPPNSLVTPKAQ